MPTFARRRREVSQSLLQSFETPARPTPSRKAASQVLSFRARPRNETLDSIQPEATRVTDESCQPSAKEEGATGRATNGTHRLDRKVDPRPRQVSVEVWEGLFPPDRQEVLRQAGLLYMGGGLTPDEAVKAACALLFGDGRGMTRD